MATSKNIFRVTNIQPTIDSLFQDTNYISNTANMTTLLSKLDAKYLVLGIDETLGISLNSISNQTQGTAYSATKLGNVTKNGADYTVYYTFLEGYSAYDTIAVVLLGCEEPSASASISTSASLFLEIYPTSKFFQKDKIVAEDTITWPEERTRQWADDSCDNYDEDESKCTGELDANHPYIYCSKRTFGYLEDAYDKDGKLKGTATKKWSKWGIPKLWSHYGLDSSGFVLTLDNSNESIYYMSEKAANVSNAEDKFVSVIDPDGCSTGSIRLNGGLVNRTTNGQITIDKLYVKEGNNEYYFVDYELQNRGGIKHNINTNITIPLNCGWTVQIRMEQENGQYSFRLIDCKIAAETKLNSTYLELLNSIARLTICAFNYEHDVTRLTVWTISAIQDVDANGIRRYRITPSPRQYQRIESYKVDHTGTKKSETTVTKNTESLKLTIEYDTYDTPWQPFDGEKYSYYVEVVNEDKQVISKTNYLTTSTTQLSGSTLESLMENLYEENTYDPKSKTKTIYARLYVNDPDYCNGIKGDEGYYRVDELEISLNFLYLRTEKGEPGLPGQNGINTTALTFICTNDEINLAVDAEGNVSEVPEDLIPTFIVKKYSENIPTTLTPSCSNSGVTFVQSANDDYSITLKPIIPANINYKNGEVIYIKWTLGSETAGEEHFYAGSIKVRLRKDSNNDGNVNDYWVTVDRGGKLINSTSTHEIKVKANARTIIGTTLKDYYLQYRTKSEANWTDSTKECLLSAEAIYKAEGYYVRVVTNDPDYGSKNGSYVEADCEFIEPDEQLATRIGEEIKTQLQEAIKNTTVQCILAGDPNQNIPCKEVDVSGSKKYEIIAGAFISTPITLIGFSTFSEIEVGYNGNYVEIADTTDEIEDTYTTELTISSELAFDVEYNYGDSILTLTPTNASKYFNAESLNISIRMTPSGASDSVSAVVTVRRVIDRDNDNVITTYSLEADVDVIYKEGDSYVPATVGFKVWEDPHNAVKKDITSTITDNSRFTLVRDSLESSLSSPSSSTLTFNQNNGYLEVWSKDLVGNPGTTKAVSLYIKGKSDYDTTPDNDADYFWADSENILYLGEMNKHSDNKGDAGKIGQMVRIRNLANVSEDNPYYCYSPGDEVKYKSGDNLYDANSVFTDGTPIYYDILSEVVVSEDKKDARIVYYLCKESLKVTTASQVRSGASSGNPTTMAGWSMTEVDDFMAVNTLIADRIDAKTVAADKVLVRNSTGDKYVAGVINGSDTADSFFKDSADASTTHTGTIGNVRIFAGEVYDGNNINLNKAPFRVMDDGTVYISKLRISKNEDQPASESDTIQNLIGEGQIGLTVAPNLVNGTNPISVNCLDEWTLKNNVSIDSINKSFILNCTQLTNNSQDILRQKLSVLAANTNYILSFELYAESETPVSTYIYNGDSTGCSTDSNIIDGVSTLGKTDGANSWIATNTWTSHYQCFKTGNFAVNAEPSLLFRMTSVGTVKVRNIKIEIDNVYHKPTPWCLSEKDKIGQPGTSVTGPQGAAGKIVRTRDITIATNDASEATPIHFYSDADISTPEAKLYYDIVTWRGTIDDKTDTYYFKCIESGVLTEQYEGNPAERTSAPKFEATDALFDFAFIDTLVSNKVAAQTVQAEEVVVVENTIPTAGIINGTGDTNKSYAIDTDVRIFAGAPSQGTAGIENAAFRVTKDGLVYASNFNGSGNFYQEPIIINATSPYKTENAIINPNNSGVSNSSWYSIDFWNCGSDRIIINYPGLLCLPCIYIDGTSDNKEIRTNYVLNGEVKNITLGKLDAILNRTFNLSIATGGVSIYYIDSSKEFARLFQTNSQSSLNNQCFITLRRSNQDSLFYYWEVTPSLMTNVANNEIWMPTESLQLWTAYFFGELSTVNTSDDDLQCSIGKYYGILGDNYYPDYWIKLGYASTNLENFLDVDTTNPSFNYTNGTLKLSNIPCVSSGKLKIVLSGKVREYGSASSLKIYENNTLVYNGVIGPDGGNIQYEEIPLVPSNTYTLEFTIGDTDELSWACFYLSAFDN